MTTTENNLKVSFIDKDTRDTEETTLTAITNLKTQMEIENKKNVEDTEFNWKGICKYAPRYYLESVPFMFNRMNPYLLNMISLIFVAFYADATLTAGFGLGNAIFMFFWQTFTQVNGETQGIGCSKAFGASDWKNMRLGFYRGLCWNYLVTIASTFLYLYIDKLLVAAGFEPEMTSQAHKMVVSMIPALYLQTINEMIRNYLMSQSVSKPFVWINLVSFAFFPVGGYYIIYWSNWGISGFGLFKFIVETLNCIGLCIVMKKYGHEESIKREPIKEILNPSAMKQYMKDFGKILAGWYASYFGLEVNTILCGMLADAVVMACWVSYMNVFAIVWTIGAGLAISTRTACGLSLGEKNYMLARKYALMGYLLAFFYSCVGGTLIICLNKQIAEAFTEVPEVITPLRFQIVLMGICTFLAGSGATGATMFRTINKTNIYTMMMLVNQVLLSTTISALGLFLWKWGAAGPGFGFIASWISTATFTVWYMLKVDWNSLASTEKDVKSKNSLAEKITSK